MKERNSNIELLRLCSMMMIMVLHFLGHSRYVGGNIFSADVLIWNLMESLCISSTAIFVLISGIFASNKPLLLLGGFENFESIFVTLSYFIVMIYTFILYFAS